MFQFFDVDRRTMILILIALMPCFTTVAVSAEEEVSGQNLGIVLAGEPYQDPDEDDPDFDPLQYPVPVDPVPDSYQDPDEDDPDFDPFQFPFPVGPVPDPYQDPDEDDPDFDPLVVEAYPVFLTELTTVLFRMDGAATVALHNAAGQRLFVAGDGDEVVMMLGAGRYEVRIEERTQGAIRFHLERIPNR